MLLLWLSSPSRQQLSQLQQAGGDHDLILRPRLTTHSSGRGVSLPFVVNLNGFGVVSRAGYGVTIIKPITATEWGTKGFYVEDPDGYIIGFGGRPAAG